MQKLVTITINIEKLQETSKGAFTLTEVEEINILLEEGWSIEEWEFITSEKETNKAVLLVVLNDDFSGADFTDEQYETGDDDEDNDDSAYDEESEPAEEEDGADDEEEDATGHPAL